MTIENLFPTPFVVAIQEALARVMAPRTVSMSPLITTSLDKQITVFPVTWVPEEDTMQIGSSEPTENNYLLRIQNLTISGDIEKGYREFTADLRTIRAILYRDETLRVALSAMKEQFLGSTERFMKMRVSRQVFNNAPVNLGIYFLCETDVTICTETTSL